MQNPKYREVRRIAESVEILFRTTLDRINAPNQKPKTLDLLEEFDIKLGMPYTKYLEKQLWELRIRVGRNRYRIIYFLHTKRTFILLHGFSKKTDAVSRADIEIAKNRRDDYLSRRRKGS